MVLGGRGALGPRPGVLRAGGAAGGGVRGAEATSPWWEQGAEPRLWEEIRRGS